MAELSTTYAVALIRPHSALDPLRMPDPTRRRRTREEHTAAEIEAEVLLRILEDVLGSSLIEPGEFR